MQLRKIIPCLFLFAASAFGQVSYSTITGTVQDLSGTVFANATISATLVNAQGFQVYGLTLPSGDLFNGSPVRGQLDASGTFSIQLVPNGTLSNPTGSQWKIRISAPYDSSIIAYSPAWDITYQFTVTGNADISAALSALATQKVAWVNLKTNTSSLPGGTGSMTWPTGTAGVAAYGGTQNWSPSYNASNKIPATFLANIPIAQVTGLSSATIIALWTGTCSTTTFLRGDGSCIAPSGTMTWPAAAGIAVYGGASAWGTSLTAPTGTIVGTTDTQTLTNKTVNGVAPATFAFLDPTSSVQTQLNGKQSTFGSQTANFFYAAPNGVAGSPAFRAMVLADLPSTLFPTLCSGGQFSQGLSSGSNNCAAPTGSGTVNSGANYKLAVYASAAATAVSPAVGLATDATGNNLLVPGSIALGATPPTNCSAINGCFAGAEGSVAGTPAVNTDHCRADSTAHGWKCSLNNGAEFVSAMNYQVSNGAGTLPLTIAKGSLALATSAIASGACQAVTAGSVNSAAATGVLTTDVIDFTANGSIKAVTGYVPASTGGLTITAYPTANNVNFDVCNWTASSITPGAVTLNWKVTR